MAVWQPLVICGMTSGEGVPTEFVHNCGWGDVIQIIKNIITDLVLISTLLVVVAFVWAGIILLTSGGNVSAKDKAKGMLWKVIIGYLWILAAWLIVYTITSKLLMPGYSLLGNPSPN